MRQFSRTIRNYSKNICVVGSGPSGFYCAKFLLKSKLDVKITMLEKLPCPYGLVRYGVAPDHPEVKKVIHEFEEIASQKDKFQFYGNIEIGKQITLQDLKVITHIANIIRTILTP
jgi:adrenodoxin-NADP+ reductase